MSEGIQVNIFSYFSLKEYRMGTRGIVLQYNAFEYPQLKFSLRTIRTRSFVLVEKIKTEPWMSINIFRLFEM